MIVQQTEISLLLQKDCCGADMDAGRKAVEERLSGRRLYLCERLQVFDGLI